MSDERIGHLIAATERMRRGDYAVEDLPPDPGDDPVGRLTVSLRQLAASLADRLEELSRLSTAITQANLAMTLEEVLDRIYTDFQDAIPYDRIGVSFVEGDRVVSIWARSDLSEPRLKNGFSAPINGSSLKQIMDTGAPRILNDLEAYLETHPNSHSTALIVEEGVRSSLTCPLLIEGRALGFIFFSSGEKNTYSDIHQGIFLQIAEQLAGIMEKGRLVSRLSQQKQMLEDSFGKQHRLNQELQVMAELVANLHYGIYIFGWQEDDLELIAANEAAAKITGVPNADLLGRSVVTAFPNIEDLGLLQIMEEVRESRKPKLGMVLDVTEAKLAATQLEVSVIPIGSYSVGLMMKGLRKPTMEGWDSYSLRFFLND